MQKTLIVKVRTVVKLSDDEEILCDQCGSICFAGAINSVSTSQNIVGSLSCRHCARATCLKCVAPLGWECKDCHDKNLLHAPSLHRTTSSKDRAVSLHEDGYATRLDLPRIKRFDTNDSISSMLSNEKSTTPRQEKQMKLEGFLYKRGKRIKGYRKMWLSVNEEERLCWRLKPGTPEKNSVQLKDYVVREGPGSTDFRLVLRDSKQSSYLKSEVLLRSLSVGDRHRWVVGLRSWCKESSSSKGTHVVQVKHDDDFHALNILGGLFQGGVKSELSRKRLLNLWHRACPLEQKKVIDETEMWDLARKRFSQEPYSNGYDKRYETVKAEIRSKYGKNAINEKTKPRLKALAMNRGLEVDNAKKKFKRRPSWYVSFMLLVLQFVREHTHTHTHVFFIYFLTLLHFIYLQEKSRM